MPSMRDGLGGEEVVTGSAAGLATHNAFFTGSHTAAAGYSTAGSIVTVGVANTADYSTNENFANTAGSPFGKGLTWTFTTRSNISGGQWVSFSGNLAYAAPASTKVPAGMAEPGTDVASGATVNVILRGIVPVIAEGTIAVGAPCIMGAGTALNTVLAATAASGVRVFSLLDAAGSESVAFAII